MTSSSKAQAGVIPKEQLTAFQRWELASFDDAGTSTAAAPHPIPESAPDAAQATELELAGIRETAREEGYGEGYAAGLAQGQAEVEARQRELGALLSGLHTELSAVPYTLADDALELALDLAQILVRGAVEVDRTHIVDVVSEALSALPRVTHPASLTLHPDDLANVQDALGSDLAGWQFRTDNALARGGCRIETADSRIDASLEHRWEKISTALGHPRSWVKAPPIASPRQEPRPPQAKAPPEA